MERSLGPFLQAHNFAIKSPYSNDSGPGHYNRLQVVDFELKQALRKFSEAAQVKGWRERLKVIKPY